MKVTKHIIKIAIPMLCASAIIRLTGSEMFAIAEDDIRRNVELQDQSDQPSAADGEAECIVPQELETLYEALTKKQAELNQLESEVHARETKLKLAQEILKKGQDALLATEERLRKTIAISSSASETDLNKMTKVYGSMQPDKAAAIFEKMDLRLAAGFVGRMEAAKMAEIMDLLPPGIAIAISTIVSGRNARAGKQDASDIGNEYATEDRVGPRND
ncbi:MotE family protein [Pseudooceanicola sp. C21-150M6]|uniref:MotE family protein n=1 Tax=Pseudooceanicola sp. C21-150M6 TaxID=3434355 RepID=UPI003D7F6A8E